MEAKKTLLTYTGLKKLEDELGKFKSCEKKRSGRKDQRSQRTGRPFQRTLSTMQQRTSSVISKHVSKNLRKSSRMQKL